MIYHLTDRAAWDDARARGEYSAASLVSEGFIHCSTRDQLLAVANDFYRGEADLLALCIDENRLRAELRWEAPSHPNPLSDSGVSGSSLFPHLYGVLNLDAVVEVYELSERETGYALPRGIP
ncbi:MAG: DUF952 domain-containing protein [Chloroflexota bacterium]|nr:DUF952 domain-containing protein [Chloroflexota bacterium]MDE2908101.1 DUF952 domain-containing protein [Chloroflexota bacterium]